MLDVLLMLAAAATGQTADPLAPGRAGKLQCLNPDRAAKTCQAIGKYLARADGGYDVTTTLLLAPSPLVTLETKSVAKVEGGKVCTVVRTAEYQAGTISMNGAPVDAAVGDGIKAQMSAALAAMEGKNACSADKAEGDLITAEVTLDGTARPDLNQKYIWVDASEGYKVAG